MSDINVKGPCVDLDLVHLKYHRWQHVTVMSCNVLAYLFTPGQDIKIKNVIVVHLLYSNFNKCFNKCFNKISFLFFFCRTGSNLGEDMPTTPVPAYMQYIKCILTAAGHQ